MQSVTDQVAGRVVRVVQAYYQSGDYKSAQRFVEGLERED